MKIKVKNYTEKEVEVKIPSYWKTDAHTYKVFSENEYDSAVSISYNYNILFVSASMIFNNNEDYEEITEAEYKNELEKATNKIKNL